MGFAGKKRFLPFCFAVYESFKTRKKKLSLSLRRHEDKGRKNNSWRETVVYCGLSG